MSNTHTSGKGVWVFALVCLLGHWMGDRAVGRQSRVVAFYHVVFVAGCCVRRWGVVAVQEMARLPPICGCGRFFVGCRLHDLDR